MCKNCVWSRMNVNPFDGYGYRYECSYPEKQYPDEIGIKEYVRRERNFREICAKLSMYQP